ncbi:hypothetical protein HDU79_011911 [Rhizoclosmatium sp. JEL0117]|nr:hypothetical protein HDU79_011911 [Rhizoclosmatium sp. JEL0117]
MPLFTTTSPSHDNNKSLLDDSRYADVLLLIGESRDPVWAHAGILAKNCEYYDSALPDRWNNPDVPAIIPNSITFDGKRSKRLLAVLSHPDVDIEPFKIVLEYIYCGTVKVPEELLKHVALVADQLLIPSLVSQCVKKIMDNTLSPETSFDVYFLCLQLNELKNAQEALTFVIDDVTNALQAGKEVIRDTSSEEVKDILKYQKFDAAQRWRIIIGWVKAKQGIENVSLESGPLGLNIIQAKNDIQDLIPILKLSLMSKLEFITRVAPFASLIESNLVEFLKGHFDFEGDIQSLASSKIILDSRIFDIPAINKFWDLLTANIKLFQPKEMKLLYRGSEHNFREAKFHERCDGKPNTIVLIKTVTSKIVGGYIDAAWSSRGLPISANEAFLFSVNSSSTLIQFMPSTSLKTAISGFKNNGPTFLNGLGISMSSCSSSNTGYDFKGTSARISWR